MSRFRAKRALIITGALCLFVATACDKTEDTPEQAKLKADVAAEAEKESAIDVTGAKLAGYVACINRHSERMDWSRGQYFKMFKDPQAGPTKCKRVRGTPGSTYEPDDCLEAVTKAVTMPPKLPELEKAGTEFANAMVALFKPNAKIDNYYTQGDHKDDACAHGLEMHPKLVALWSAYGQAEDTLRVELDKVSDKVAVEKLAALEKKHGPDDVRFLHRKIMVDSLAVLRLFETQMVAESFDEELITSKTTALADTIDKLAAVCEKDEAAAEELLEGIPRFASYQAMQYRKAIKEFMRATKARKRKKILQEVIKEYNRLIENSNNLNRFR